MFTQPVSSPPTVGPVPTSVTNPASPSARSSRLRGLSYLRNYTQNHLLSREHSSQGSNSPTSNSHTHSHFHHNTTISHSQTQTQTQTQTQNSRDGTARPTQSLQRSLSYSPPTSAPRRADPESSLNPLSLVASLQEPASSASPANRAATTPSSPAVERPAVDALPSAINNAAVSSNNNISQAAQHADQPSQPQIDTEAANMTRARASTTGDAAPAAPSPVPDNLPSIRFSAYYDPRATRPSLTFPPVSRTLPSGGEIIRVGRYSERDNQPNVPNNTPSAAPVGFKSKVVSRRHCEFWYDDGKWYIKDVKSSSGTFLNHIRLSPPGTESKPFPVNDGDIVQLGIDFKGGEEMIFRCVKMRLELNRGWQTKLNTFNMATHKRLRNMTSANSANSSTSQDCSICLNSIAPCQCLFVAPCSHTWHFKCIRSLLNSPQYPIFVCPNCRMAADLEADIEDPAEEWEQMEDDEEPEQQQETKEKAPVPSEPVPAPVAAPAPAPTLAESSRPLLPEIGADSDVMDFTVALERVQTVAVPPEAAPRTVAPNSITEPVPIPAVGASQAAVPRNGNGRDTRTPSPIGNHLVNGNEGPITPRNDAGPWVFDGSAGRRAAEASNPMRSLDEAAEMDVDR